LTAGDRLTSHGVRMPDDRCQKAFLPTSDL
jgi:hypothetical protein